MTDDSQAASARQADEERLQLAIEATGIGTWDVDAVTGFRRWSPEFRKICGLPEDAAADPKLFSALIHPDDREWVNRRYQEVYEGASGGHYEAECRILRHNDGAERHVLIRGRISYDSSGKALRGIGTLLDITDQKRTAQALAESEERYRLAVTAFHGAAYETDLVTGYANRAPRAYEMLGFAPDDGEPTRDWWFSRIHPDDAPRFHQTLEALLSGAIPELNLEFRIRHADGSWVWVWQRGLAVHDRNGRLRRTVGALLDITDRKRTEAALRESEARFRHMADSAPALIWMTDAEGRTIFANMHFGYLFGIPAAEMLARGWESVVLPEDIGAFAGRFAEAFAARQPFRAEVRVRDKHGQTRWLRCEGVPRLDDAGAFLGYTGCGVDITDAKVAQEGQLLLINELNHRVKNTLATVQSIASQTLRNAATTGEARSVFEARLIALSRAHDVLTRENWEGAGLREIVAQAIEPYRSHGERAFRIDGPDVRLSPTLALALAMALQELATNAVKYGALSKPEGCVRITWSTEHSGARPQLALTWQEEGGPPVAPPTRRGFGSKLVQRTLAQDPYGEVRLQFAPTGVVCTFRASLG
jgi:PAS domain S-box-containing protein